MDVARIVRLAARRSQVAAEKRELVGQRKRIIDDVEAEKRKELTGAEDAEFRELTAKIEKYNDDINDYDERITELAEEAERRGQVTGATAALQRAQGGAGGGGLALPADLSEEELRNLFNAVRSATPYRVQCRSVMGGGDPMQVWPTFAGATYRDMPRIASLFPMQATEGATVRVYVATTAASAGVTAEGAAKHTAGLALTPKDVEVIKITSWERMSYELTADFPMFVNQVRTELTRAVTTQENAELTTELLAAPLAGQASAGDNGVDSSATAIATLEAAGITPDAVVLSPGRLAAIRQAKDGGTGAYVVSPLQGGPPTLHGLRVVPVPTLDDDTMLVGAFNAAGTVFLRESMSIRVGLDGSDFSENMISTVVEERLALAITQPSRVVKVDLATV